MSRRRSYYDVLGVSRNATTEQLHRAHRALARRYHPDAAPDSAEVGSAEAARRIREVNEAWQELRDPHRRARYDQTLEPEPAPARTRSAYDPFPPGTEPEPPGGFDEWFADADLRRSQAKVVRRAPRPVKPFRVRLLFGFGAVMLAGILLVVFLTGASDERPGTGIGRGACVQVDSVGLPVQVPCEGPNDGRIVGQVSVAGECPNGSMARQLSTADPRLTCLEP